VGNDGETLVADSSTSTGLRYQGNYAAGKNAIINGAFNVWQRGTSFNNNGGTYTADRWVITGSGTAPTVSQQTFTPGTAPVAGYEGQFYLRFDQSSAATAAQTFQQRIEDVRNFAGQNATISFFAKANSGSTAPDLKITQSFGSGGSTAVTTTVQASISFTASWVRYSYTIAVPSVSAKTIGTGSSLQVYLQFPTSGTWQHDYWGWQMEAGSVATAFQTATGTLQGELAACQRYYYQFASGATKAIGIGTYNTTTEAYTALTFPVTMRTTPTLSATTGTAYYRFQRSGSSDDFNSLTMEAAHTNGTWLYNNTEMSGTAGVAGVMKTQDAASSLAFSAEL
jgi:hypothetical protein